MSMFTIEDIAQAEECMIPGKAAPPCPCQPEQYISLLAQELRLEETATLEEIAKNACGGIREVIYADPATIVIFGDGEKTKAVCRNGDTYNKEMGLAICLLKRLLPGNTFHKVFKYWTKNGDEKHICADTLLFGKIKIKKNKVVHFPDGIIGFPEAKEFAIINKSGSDGIGGIQWLQSLDSPELALPVTDPTVIKEGYSPEIKAGKLSPLGKLREGRTLVLVTVTVTESVEDITANLCAPIIINMDTMLGMQVEAENGKEVRYRFYDKIQKPGR